jgi:signal transduction histidine kinase
MGCSAAVQVLAGGDDVVFLLVGLGWWFIGRLLRSRMAVADSLRIRAVELAAERDRFAAEAVALERTKIARELHDVVAHCMTVVVIQSRAGRQLLGTDPEAAREAVDVIVAVTAEAEADIGALVELMDPVRGRPLTRAGLDELVGRAAMTGTSITVAITGEPDDLAPELAKVARRVVQEALTNCLRHAPGAAITIDISCGPTVVVAVANGPTGSTPSTGAARADLDDGSMTQQASLGWAGAGKGLLGLRERVAEAGGEVNWGSIESGGWLVRAVFPS